MNLALGLVLLLAGFLLYVRAAYCWRHGGLITGIVLMIGGVVLMASWGAMTWLKLLALV